MREIRLPGLSPRGGSIRFFRRKPRLAPRPSAASDGLPELPPEFAALRHLVDPAVLRAAMRRARALDVGLDEVLRAHGILSPDEIAKALARALGLPFDPLDNAPATSPALSGACRTGVLRRAAGIHTIAARGKELRSLASALRRDPKLKSRLLLTSPERMAAHVRRAGAEELSREAVSGLRDWRPALSAGARGKRGLRKLALLTVCAISPAAYCFPQETLAVVEFALCGSFLAWAGLRLQACPMQKPQAPRADIADRALPYYSVVVALYREARVVGQLVAALKRLEYPREKLEIKFVCEADDEATIAAIEALRLDPRFEILIAPDAAPRTKPKALMAALPFVRGRFLTVYDAEDVPEPDQLRKALAAYARGPKNLACVQARLAIDNVGDNWLTRHFAAEYAGLFDVFLPALADLRLPLPLGGTSNHFRTDVLREVGGWDPYNVTEDADLGMRLARFGYLSGVIDSTTYEEAPARLGAWLKQRTRWCKGWLQTWFVHMRAPGALFRELGLGGFLAFQLLVGGTVLAALVHPFFLALVLTDATLGKLFVESDTIGAALRQGLVVTTLLSGYLASASLALLGLRRRKLLASAWVLLLLPLYWILLSFAAWRGAVQLIAAPYLWEKTEHGLARTSRYGKCRRQSALADAARKFRAASANRPPPRPRSAAN